MEIEYKNITGQVKMPYSIGIDAYQSLSIEDQARYEYDYVAGEYTLRTGTYSEPQLELPGVEATLSERGSRYGVFAEHARIAQNIQDAMRDSPNWQVLPSDIKQALQVIADKAARVLNGDMLYLDNWHDIVGYATLIEKRIKADLAALND